MQRIKQYLENLLIKFDIKYTCCICYEEFRINSILIFKKCKCNAYICDQCLKQIVLNMSFKCVYCKTINYTNNFNDMKIKLTEEQKTERMKMIIEKVNLISHELNEINIEMMELNKYDENYNITIEYVEKFKTYTCKQKYDMKRKENKLFSRKFDLINLKHILLNEFESLMN